MIEVVNAGKTYGRRRGTVALRGVSLTIPRGRVTAVIGPNGAGKSTLFGLVMGFIRPTAGDISIVEMDPRDYVHQHGIGYVSERFGLPPGWPVRRALTALGGLSGLDATQVGGALTSFGLAEHADKPVGSLSRGLLQRLGLAQAFAAARDLLVLDEPAEGLDALSRIRLRDAITAQRTAGRTVLLASHDLAEVERIADTIVILEHGTVKDIMENSSGTRDSPSFRVRLARPLDTVRDLFPDAIVDGAIFTTTVTDNEDFNNRLAALIDSGGRIVDIVNAGEPFEARVRRSIES